MLELLGLVTLGLAWLVPNHYPPWRSFYNESLAALGLVFLLLAYGRRVRSTPQSIVIWFVLAIASVPWFQWLSGLLSFSGDALVGSLYVIGLAVAVTTGDAWAAVNPSRAATRFFVTVVVMGGVSTALALFQAVGIGEFGIWAEPSVPGMRAVANLGQPNNLATLLGFSVVGLLYLHERRYLTAIPAILLAMYLIAGLAATESRTALLFGPAIAAGLWLSSRRGVEIATPRTTVALLVLFHWVLTITWPMLRADVLSLPLGSSAVRLAEGSLRAQMWPLMLDAAAQSPWTGYGWLQVGAAQLAVADAHLPVSEFWMQAHNLFLDLIIWCGYPIGFLLIIAVLWWYVSRAARVQTLEAVTAFLAISLFAIHAMLEFPHQYAYFLIPVGLWIGHIEATIGATRPLGPRWNLLAPVLAMAMLVAIWKDYPSVEEDFRLVRFESMRIRTGHTAESAANATFLSTLTEFISFSRTEPRPAMSPDELNSMFEVARRYPYAPSLYRLARALALNGQLDAAVRMLDRLRRIHGDGSLLRIQLDLRERIADGDLEWIPLEAAIAGIELQFTPQPAAAFSLQP